MPESALQTVLVCAMGILSVLMLLCLARAILGPLFSDRIVASNLVTSLSTAFIILLSIYLDESFLLDVALVFALLGFLGTVVITRVATFRHYGTMMHKEDLADDD